MIRPGTQILVALMPYGSRYDVGDDPLIEVDDRATVRDFMAASLFDLLVLRVGLERVLRAVNRAIDRQTRKAA